MSVRGNRLRRAFHHGQQPHDAADPNKSWCGSPHAPGTVAEWIEDHAYDVDDIVLDGDSPLGPKGLAALQLLLDIAQPGWREVFKSLPKHAEG